MRNVLRLLTAAGVWFITAESAVYAHEDTITMEQGGIPWNSWVLIVLCAATAGLTVWYWLRNKQPEGRALKTAALLVGTGAVLMGAFNASGLWERKEAGTAINLIHIHGLVYADSGSKVMLATHDGIKSYEDSHWHNEEGAKHDYMGFSPFEGGFYSSGHPAADSSLQNPLGLVKSADGGKTIDILALHGKVDFHLMAASYRTRVLYVFNPEPNAALKQPGLYITKDEGKTWSKSAMNGFAGDPTAIAVHPELGEIVALGSRDGLFLSTDAGNTFEKLLPGTGISALSFDRDGLLSVGGFKVSPSLLQLDIASRKLQEVPLPDLKEDAIAYTAHHPQNPQERMITTYDQDVFLTKDGGETWAQLADNGKTKEKPEIFPKLVKKPS